MKNLNILIIAILICLSFADMRGKNSSFSRSSIRDSSIEFLELFKDIKPQGLHVYSIEYDKNRKLIQSPFVGISIDVKKFSYLNNQKIFWNIEACKEGQSEIFEIGKFEINNKYLGLLFRQFSQYDESVIQLLLWDKSEKKIIEGLDLADSFGDEGWYFDKESWITDYEFNKKLTVTSRKKDSTLTEDAKSPTITDSLKISEFDGLKFKTINTNQIDTTNYKLKIWK